MAKNGTKASVAEPASDSGEDQLHALEMQQQFLNPDATTLDPTLNAILNESNRKSAIISNLRERLQVEVLARLEAEKRAEIAEAALAAVRGGKSTDQ